MIIVDSSALTNALTDHGEGGKRCRAELARDSRWLAPEQLIAETFNAIRGRHLDGKINEELARWAVGALRRTTIELIQVQDLLHQMWELRGHVSGYDAAYLAAAEHFCYPLVTSDARLARSADGLECDVRLVWPDPE